MWLLIDDTRDLGCEVIVRNSYAAYQILDKFKRDMPFDCIGFDHDLGYGDTGLDVMKYMFRWCFDLPKRIQLVTSNPVGRENMKNVLLDNGYSTKDNINFYKK